MQPSIPGGFFFERRAMSFAAYSLTPSANLTIAGQSIAEGTTSPGTVNLAIRQLMADGKELADSIADIDLTSYATKAGAVFSGTQPIYTGRGAYVHHNNPSNSSGRIFVQAYGSAAPSMSNGDILLEY